MNFILTCLFWTLTKWSATARAQADSSAKERNPNPRLFFFSWSYMMTTSTTSPYRVKKERRSVSVMLDGRPPRNTFGQGSELQLELK